MNCEQIKELILCDYSDKETSPQVTSVIEEHLKNCPDCREFQAQLLRVAQEPLRAAKEINPPEYVWYRIKDAIATEREPQRRSIWEDLIQRIHVFFNAPKLAMATSLVTVMVVGAIMFQVSAFQRRAAVQDYFKDQADFFTYFSMNNQYSKNTDTSSFGSIAENLL